MLTTGRFVCVQKINKLNNGYYIRHVYITINYRDFTFENIIPYDVDITISKSHVIMDFTNLPDKIIQEYMELFSENSINYFNLTILSDLI